MKISVFGLGYVGVITAACLADEGYEVIGVDINKSKVDLINTGETPIYEDKISDIIKKNVKSGKFRAILNAEEAIKVTDIGIICVGTPSLNNGLLDDRYLKNVIKQIGESIKPKNDKITIVLRSTVIPGTVKKMVIPNLEKYSGKKLGEGFEFLYYPEFMREGSAVYDYYHPPKIVIGELNNGASEVLLNIYDEKYNAPRIICDPTIAEMVKYCDNIFHALKITFANEIGHFCKSLDIDSHEVMDIFCQDKKLNISTKYLRPGFAFGGSCLPKDLRAILAVSKENHLELPMIQSILSSNTSQIENALKMILNTNANSFGFYGIAFKKGTDDLRESPYVEIAERLIGKGKKVQFYDEMVQISKLTGKNKSYIESKFPHLSEMLISSLDDLLTNDLILICHKPENELLDKFINTGKKLFDITGLGIKKLNNNYQSVV